MVKKNSRNKTGNQAKSMNTKHFRRTATGGKGS